MAGLGTGWRLLQVAGHLALGALLTLALGAARHVPAATVRWWHGRLCRILRLRIVLADEAGQAQGLLVCNHVSWLDIPVLGALRGPRFVAKSEVRRWPLAGWLAERTGTLFIRRGAIDLKRLGREMGAILDQGRDLVLFPEGTTSDGGDVLPFFPRLLAPALEANRPIIPVALRYAQADGLSPSAPFIGEDALLPHLARLVSGPPTDVYVHLCRPLPTTERDRRSLAVEARRSIREALAGLPGGLRHTPRPAPAPLSASVIPQLRRCSWK